MGWVKASALLWLACLTSLFAGELSVALGPLQNPSLPNAKLAVANLTKLAAAQNGAIKTQSERLAVLLKNLFRADYQVAEALKAGKQAEAAARRKERISADWMKPNILGRVNEVASREALAKAVALRHDAARRIADARQSLVEQLKETDSVIEDFHNLEEFDVVLVLAETSAKVAARSLPKDSFKSSFPPDSLAKVRESLRLRDEQMR